MISTASTRPLCGASPRLAITTTSSRSVRVSPARAGSLGKDRIRSRLMDTATNSSPVGEAPAPTSAAKKVCQGTAEYAAETVM
jgi:hypothetical protein